MKKILFVIGLLISFLSQGQTWSKITTGSKYTYTTYLGTLRSDSGLIIPTYNSLTTPYFKDTIGNLVRYNDSLYFRTSAGWRNIGKTNNIGNTIYTGDGKYNGNRIINAATKSTTFDSSSSFYIKLLGNTAFGLFRNENNGNFLSSYTENSTSGNTIFNVRNPFGSHYTDDGFSVIIPNQNSSDAYIKFAANGGFGSLRYYSSLSNGVTDTIASRRYVDSITNGVSNYWSATGNDIANNNNGNVTIKGAYYPSGLFQVNDSLRSIYAGDFNGLFGTYNGTYSETNDQSEYFKWYCKDYYTNPLMQLNGNGNLYLSHITNATSDKQLMYNSSTGEFTYADTLPFSSKADKSTTITAGINLTGGGSLASNITLNADTTTGSSKLATQGFVTRSATGGTVRSIATTAPILGGTITTTGTISADTGRGLNQLATSGSLNKVKDSLSVIIATKGTVNSIATSNSTGILGGTITTSGTLSIDTTLISTRAWRQKGVDSLNTIIATKGSGTVISVATGLGLSGGTITTSGTLLVDTSSTSILSRQRAATTYAPISINGTVTSVAGTSGLGISASVANSTTTPNITIAVDTSDASILSRQRAAATYLPLTGGTLSSRLTGTSLILNKDSLPTVTGKTWGLVIDTGNSNRISRQILPTGTVTSITLGRGITGSSPITTTGTIGLDTSKGYTWTGVNTIKDSIYIPKIVGGTGINSGIDFYSSSNPASINANDFNFYGWDALGNRTRKAYLQSTAGGVFHCNTITSISSSISLESMSGSVQFAPTGIYCGAVSYTSSIPTLIITNGGGNAGKICVGGNPVASTAMLEMQSTTKGLLPPRMTTTQKNAISSPAEGLIVYDLTLHKLSIYTGSTWETITSL